MARRPLRLAAAASLAALLLPAWSAAGEQKQSTSNSTVYNPNGTGQVGLGQGQAMTLADQVVMADPHNPPKGVQYLKTVPGTTVIGQGTPGDSLKITPDFFGGAEEVDKMFVGSQLRPGALNEFLHSQGFKGSEAISPEVAHGLMRFFEDQARERAKAGHQPPDTRAVAPALKTELGSTFVELVPKSPIGYQYLGTASGEKGDNAKAVAQLTKAIELGAPPQARYQRGLYASRAGDNELANADARAVLKAEPGNAEAQSLFMLTRSRPSTVRLMDPGQLAADDGRLAAAGMPEASRPQWDGSQAFEPAGAPQGGLSADQIAAQENAAMNARPVTLQSAKLTRDAKASLRVKDPKSALRFTEEALKADPTNVDARFVRANAFLQLREPGRAALEASAGLELAPDNGPLLYTRAVANGRQKLWREAYADAERTVRAAPRADYAYKVRAAANWGLGRKAEMLKDLAAAASLDPSYADVARRASQLPTDVDPTLLFGDASPAPGAAPAAAPASRPPYLFWGIGSLLAVIGIAPFLVPDLRGKVTTVFRRGPAPADDAGGGGEAPLAGFWKRYEVTREIGAGGMGVVYEAWDRQLERRVAVKRMRDEIRNDRRERERFLQEARLVARLRHPNLVEIYSIEEDGDDAYLVFEFVEGQNLHEMLQEKGRFTPAEAREVFRGLCAGVAYAHRQKIVHRDLKPANVIVHPDGEVKVMDFGIARQAQEALHRRQMTNTIIGTPQYMAPEQEEGVVCPQSDVYALGVCLYEALCGTAPFTGSAGAVTLAKREAKYEPLNRRVSDLPESVAAVVDRALDPDPNRRTQTPEEFFRELDAAVGAVPSQA